MPAWRRDGLLELAERPATLKLPGDWPRDIGQWEDRRTIPNPLSLTDKDGPRSEPIRLPLVTENGLHSSLQRFGQRSTPLGIVEIANITQVPKVERYVLFALRDKDHLPPKRVGDARFIEHVRVSARAVAHDDTRTID